MGIEQTSVGIVALADDKRIVGRTRMQKLVCLFALISNDTSYAFEYRHYGPYSEELSEDLKVLKAQGRIREEKKQATWGGTYSVYTSDAVSGFPKFTAFQKRILRSGIEAHAIDLELAVTAAWLKSSRNEKNPWQRVEQLKWEKAERLEDAKALYKQIKKHDRSNKLPNLDA